MRRVIHLNWLVLLLLVACNTGTQEEVPTPLPTAVPPENPTTPGDWATSFRHEFPPGFWAEGVHRYGYRFRCPASVWEAEDFSSEWLEFEVTSALPSNTEDEIAYLRLSGISQRPFSQGVAQPLVHPGQTTVAIIHLVGLSEENAQLAASECEVLVGWDLGAFVTMTAVEPFRP